MATLLTLLPQLHSSITSHHVQIILASSSPRRIEALSLLLGGNQYFTVSPSSFPETLPHSNFSSAQDYCLATAREKAWDVVRNKNFLKIGRKKIVLAMDTVVEHKGNFLEKPKNAQEAKGMLMKYRGETHFVHTGVVVVELSEDNKEKETIGFVETSGVVFAEFGEEEVDAYVATGEPLDKAGGYGVQGLGRLLVEKVDGDFFNVVGFPARRFAVEFEKRLRVILKD